MSVPVHGKGTKTGAQLAINFDDSRISECDKCDQVTYEQHIDYTELTTNCGEKMGHSYWDVCSKKRRKYYGNSGDADGGGFNDFAGVWNATEYTYQLWKATNYMICIRKGKRSQLASFKWWYEISEGNYDGGFGVPSGQEGDQ